MGKFGQALGGLAGTIGSQFIPIPGVDGGQLGSFLGGMLPFARGGIVPPRGYRRGGRVQRKRKTRSRK